MIAMGHRCRNLMKFQQDIRMATMGWKSALLTRVGVINCYGNWQSILNSFINEYTPGGGA